MGWGLKAPWLGFVPNPPTLWESKASRRLACSLMRRQQVAQLLPSRSLLRGLVAAPKPLFFHLPLLWMQNILEARRPWLVVVLTAPPPHPRSYC